METIGVVTASCAFCRGSPPWTESVPSAGGFFSGSVVRAMDARWNGPTGQLSRRGGGLLLESRTHRGEGVVPRMNVKLAWSAGGTSRRDVVRSDLGDPG